MGFLREFFGSSHEDEEQDDELLDEEEDEVAEAQPTFDAVAVLEAAGVSAEERKHVTRAQELLGSLPPDTPAKVERKIVEAAFRAFDVPLEDILSAAHREIETFEEFIEAGKQHARDAHERGEDRIAELEAAIARIRANLERVDEEQRILQQAATEEIGQVRPIVDFFEKGRSVPPPAETDIGPPRDSDDGSSKVVVDMGAGD